IVEIAAPDSSFPQTPLPPRKETTHALHDPRQPPRPRPACPAATDRRPRRRGDVSAGPGPHLPRSEEHTSELPSLMRISYAVLCLKQKTTTTTSSRQHNHN